MNRHDAMRRYRETADVDVANAKEKPRNLANVYHADSRARSPPRISHAASVGDGDRRGGLRINYGM